MKRNYGDTIIIIGAGISGLAAGCYAQMNGYRSQIFEMHDQPGGLCTLIMTTGKGFMAGQAMTRESFKNRKFSLIF
jgi:phytoene dehydrogenase-like protein